MQRGASDAPERQLDQPANRMARVARPLAADRDFDDALGGQHHRQPLPQIALQDDHSVLADTPATQGLLELSAPLLELALAESQLVDDGDLFPAPVFAFEPDHRTRRATH